MYNQFFELSLCSFKLKSGREERREEKERRKGGREGEKQIFEIAYGLLMDV